VECFTNFTCSLVTLCPYTVPGRRDQALHSLENFYITRATTEIAAQVVPYLGVAGTCMATEEVGDRDNESRSSKAALRRAVIDKRLLNSGQASFGI
jgi:hypothetical protein